MSKVLMNQYYQNVERTLKYGKSHNEQSIRHHFLNLLNEYARKQNYDVVPELAVMGTRGKKVYPDGTVKSSWGLDIGYWESKDEKDDIQAEINAKIAKGYPLDNILFEDSKTAVLFQRGVEVRRAIVEDADQLHQLLTEFFDFKNDNVYRFEEAIEKFKADIPAIVATLRNKIIETRKNNQNFLTAQEAFWELCKAQINPEITIEDIREMMIQHLLTSDIFNKIFDDPDFHHHNTIAAELEKLVATLFTYAERRNLLGSIENYYEAINATAAGITDHHEKQKFLKVLYENFYKVYNPKAADRLGVVYTPNEIVQFMVKSTDYLLHKHFGRTLADKNVEILDPATGTGTFICEIIEHAIPKQNLEFKYKYEIHANEVAILPYYIANLNIEYTFKQKMNSYVEFQNLCFVDTLDNTSPLNWARMRIDQGVQETMFGLTSDNTERIRRQNKKKISVIIGNPPYNANQLNENENNKNREYPLIDRRIKDTYIKHSTAQKTKVYDMYARFYRWASDRIDKNGVLALITNRSFIDSRTFDGFRKCIQEEFSYCYIVDTKSDVRANPKIAGTTHNVFGIQTGVAIMFLIKKERHDGNCQIQYVTMEDHWRKEEKLDWLRNHSFEQIVFQSIRPDKNNNWINLGEENDWESLLPSACKSVKFGREKKAIFKFFAAPIKTNRDEWVYDFSKNQLQIKIDFLVQTYLSDLKKYKGEKLDHFVNYGIKWSSALKENIKSGITLEAFNDKYIRKSIYRPFTAMFYYADKKISDRLTSNHYNLWGVNLDIYNFVITFNYNCSIFALIATNSLIEYGSLLVGGGSTQCLPLYFYDGTGQRLDNITDWGLKQFRQHYGDRKIKKEDIFHYTYSVLHHPAYRQKYELNLKREFPRLPFYTDFWQWAKWGQQLMALHIGYETVEPFPLEQIDLKIDHDRKLKVKLRADKIAGTIELDEMTTLKGIPAHAWDYKLGNRSAVEWVLDQYKEKKPKDPTIAEKFDTYRFADYKNQVIDLLKRVCTVSVETMKIIEEMKQVQG